MNLEYTVRRVLQTICLLFVVVTLNFFLPRMVFDDPAQPYYAGIPEDETLLRQAIREEYGFDRPVIVQYGIYLKKVISLDFGNSYLYKQPVFEVMFQKIPWSMVLSLTSMLLSVFLGIKFGSCSALNRGKFQDQLLLKLSNLSTAIPSFWLAMVLVMIFAFLVPIFPYRGAMSAGYQLVFYQGRWIVFIGISIAIAFLLFLRFRKLWIMCTTLFAGCILSVLFCIPIADLLDIMHHAALPVFVLLIGGVVSYALLVRNSMIGVMKEDFILTARAKGVPKKKILSRHILRNALLPLVTSVGMSFAQIFGGSILIEKIFSWPGMGQLLNEANAAGDFQLQWAILLFFAVVTIFFNIITDMIYQKLDPRVTMK